MVPAHKEDAPYILTLEEHSSSHKAQTEVA